MSPSGRREKAAGSGGGVSGAEATLAGVIAASIASCAPWLGRAEAAAGSHARAVVADPRKCRERGSPAERGLLCCHVSTDDSIRRRGQRSLPGRNGYRSRPSAATRPSVPPSLDSCDGDPSPALRDARSGRAPLTQRSAKCSAADCGPPLERFGDPLPTLLFTLGPFRSL